MEYYQEVMVALSESVIPEAPPSGGLTMTVSYPVGNTTSLSQKPCMVAKQLLWIIYWKLWSLFQNW